MVVVFGIPKVLREEIDKGQNRAAKLVTNIYCSETGSMIGILEK